MSRLTIRIEVNGNERNVVVTPDEVRVSAGDRLEVSVERPADLATYKCTEVHMPGNQERDVMRGRVMRANTVYLTDSATIRIGKKAMTGPHPLRVYAHFSGSLQTDEGRTPVGRTPTMIVM